ncbi:HD domain-containing phosphohydrolase [Polynucleobacter necessarius]|uniref:HD domain-containing phosphohydrolase n=1 Tax=Polynucleobacter necessarius TaxID=576610 RepID=UPI0018D55C98|nr:HD domain-containing phosphohydrolase [Polynucleobacter necessarius]
MGKAEDDSNKTVAVIGGTGSALAYIKNISVSWSEQNVTGLVPGGTCIRTAKPNVIKDSEVDEGFLPWMVRAREYGIRSAVGCPIPSVDGGHSYGCLLVDSKVPNAFGDSEVQLFESLAQEIGFGLRPIERQHKLDDQIHEKQLTQERLDDALRATIEAMAKTMEWRDPYTAGHQKKVASIATAIAKKMGMSDETVQALYMAAMVHDIGKVAVPSDILTKPTRLTDLEIKLVQGHVESGYQILKDVPFPWPIADIVRQHHERLDGSGYPFGLKGDEISLAARILAVADTIEAMATHRPYPPAKGLVAAMSQVHAEAGISLDAKVVDAAFALMDGDNALQSTIDIA